MQGSGDMDTYPLAYCPPGSICGMLSIPRALPPVTHGSALQAPECLRVLVMWIPVLIGQDAAHSALLPRRQYYE